MALSLARSFDNYLSVTPVSEAQQACELWDEHLLDAQVSKGERYFIAVFTDHSILFRDLRLGIQVVQDEPFAFFAQLAAFKAQYNSRELEDFLAQIGLTEVVSKTGELVGIGNEFVA